MSENYIQDWEKHKGGHEGIKKIEGTINTIKANMVIGPEAEANRAESLKTMKQLIERAKAQAEEGALEAQKFASKDSPELTKMYLDAYEDYYNFLEAKADKAPAEQLNSILDNIGNLEKLLESQELRNKIEHHEIPGDLKDEFDGQDLKNLTTIFVNIFSQKLADRQMAPESGFSNEELDAMYHSAADELREIKKTGPDAGAEDEESSKLRTTTSGPTRVTRPKADWAGWFPKRENRKNVKASRGIKS